MQETKRRLLLSAFKLFDLCIVVLSFGLTMLLVGSESPTLSLAEFLSMKVKLSNFVIFGVMLVVWHVLLLLCGLYESKRLDTRRSEIFEVLRGTTLISMSMILVASVVTIHMATPAFIALFWAFSSACFVCGRLIGRHLLEQMRRRGRNLHYILILGTNERAIAFASRIEAKPELGYRVLGFVDDEWEGTAGFLTTGYTLCCNSDGLADYLRKNVVDEVAIYLPLRTFYEDACRVAELCEQHGIITRFDSDIFDLKTAKPRTDNFDGDAHIAVYTNASEAHLLFLKRTLDFAVSSFLLIVLAPLFVAVPVLIKFTSPGPVFFCQERVGLNKRRFRIYKFRTMVRNAEQLMAQLEALNELSGPVFKIKNDPRLTPIGKFIRRTSIDELPQLFNVLRGDMSLVGPRPMAVRDFEGFNEDWQRRRFSVRPGITCLWQISGRNLIPFQKWMELDLQYIEHWTLWLDLKILARTIPAVLKGIGAA
jgi:exopolysaccharide biosynthesis polyprenyl glycosylphosphotransferase